MSRRGPEGKIQDAVIKYARESYNALCKKNEAGRFGGGGWPDYVIFPDNGGKSPRDCDVFFIEFKAPGGVLTPKQAHTIISITERGYVVHVVDSVALGRKIIDEECG